jgi:hypothetical protein
MVMKRIQSDLSVFSAYQFCENQAWTDCRQDSVLEILSTKFDKEVQQRVEYVSSANFFM